MESIEIFANAEGEGCAPIPVLVLVPEVRRALEEARAAFLRRDPRKAAEALDRAVDRADHFDSSLEVGGLASFYRLSVPAGRAFVKAMRQAAGDRPSLARLARDADGAGFPGIAHMARRLAVRATPAS